MSYRSRPLLLVLLLAVLAPGPLAARERAGDSAADLCLRAAEGAAQKTGVPLAVLLALTMTETGRSRGGTLQPWPWALNQGGDSHWFDTGQEALEYLHTAVDSGVTNIDVGCFQLNYRWHGAAFPSLEAMMEPEANALYAARLVQGLAGDSGDWVAAAGAYHSATPDLADRYLARFTPIYQALSQDAPRLAAAEDAPPRAARDNGFPLLRPEGARSAGSIVPIAGGGRPLFGDP